MRLDISTRILARSVVVLLILAVASLSVVATHGRYLPESDPVHFLPTATKMNVAAPVALAPPVYAIVGVVPAQPDFWSQPFRAFQKLELRQIGLTVALQHRSPPSFLA